MRIILLVRDAVLADHSLFFLDIELEVSFPLAKPLFDRGDDIVRNIEPVFGNAPDFEMHLHAISPPECIEPLPERRQKNSPLATTINLKYLSFGIFPSFVE